MAPSISAAPPASLPLSFTPKKPQINVDIVEIPTDSEESELSPTVDPLDSERARLRRHLGLDTPHATPQIQPLFFIERVPDPKVPVTCSLPGCTAGIHPGSLRLALNPGMSSDTWFRSSSGTLTYLLTTPPTKLRITI
ncbi:hypothetical protein BJX76DRAFT_363115 [Aspergillus varians]